MMAQRTSRKRAKIKRDVFLKEEEEKAQNIFVPSWVASLFRFENFTEKQWKVRKIEPELEVVPSCLISSPL